MKRLLRKSTKTKYSIVTRLTYKSNSFLFTGDAQKETIEQLVKKGYNLQAQVFKSTASWNAGYFKKTLKKQDQIIDIYFNV